MMNSNKFISLYHDVIESDAMDISTAVTAYVSSNDIECLLSIRDGQIRKNSIMNITLTYSKADGVTA